ncbi:MAG: hypothetical protein ONB13_02230 [candidate division KSB1 bacterium]|nr:hypothetical protein [candidate division KSB1 bacterium]MDZ7336447.1 hypothetical protein [candidate division KSB1 bacterium]MDZ7356277.1 hypothetical protein [candidate division KSB1 bacterium]MDZ7375414.1 hypothetical protein [candidate division KSB1 bacterium]MDZ7400082.1 hypothetical protein [candidate division KSB1 bacterium]
MSRIKIVFAILFLTLLSLTLAAQADVKRESVTKMDFKGTLGTIMRIFGADKPMRTVEYYKGNVFRSDNIDDKGRMISSQIIDLDKELFITLDHKDKKFTQMTFEEFRQMMARTLEQMKSDREKAQREHAEVEWDFKVNVTKPGETEVIVGQPAEKVIINILVTSKTTQPAKQEGAAQTAQGDLIVSSSNWMVKSIDGQKEIENFYLKFAEKLGMMPDKGGLEQMMRQLNQSYPQLADAMKKLQEESKKLSGVPVRTHTVYETRTQATPSSGTEPEKKSAEIPTSVGGLLKGISKKVAKSEKSESSANVLLEISDELVSAEVVSIEASQFEIPANYKLQPNAMK